MTDEKNLTPQDIHDAADLAGISWDEDNIFMSISRDITGKEHIDNMSQDEFREILYEIETNPGPFTKVSHFSPGKFNLKSKNEKDDTRFEYFRENHDYVGENYLDKVERKLRRLSKTLKRNKKKKEADSLDEMIESVKSRT